MMNTHRPDKATPRRTFLKAASASVAAVKVASSTRLARGQSANDSVSVGLIGCGGRGRRVANLMRGNANCRFIATSDPHTGRAESAALWAGSGAKTYEDFRDLLDHPGLDAVLIATPDHWHAGVGVLALRAGKDIYLEKPVALTIAEGRALIREHAKTDRVIQVGTQHRSAPHTAEAAELVRSGAIGKLHLVRVWTYMNLFPSGIGRQDDGTPPPELNWDLYLGPAPAVAFNPNRFGGTYRWFWDYSGGLATDYGVHRFDSVHQITGATSPHTISASGGRLVLDDGAETPDTLIATFRYPEFVMTYEASALSTHGLGGRTPEFKNYRAFDQHDRPSGMAFYGTEGALFVDRIGYELYPEPGHGTYRNKQGADRTDLHTKNFIDCVRTRNQPNAPLVDGHHATNIAHLANIALKTGRTLRYDGEQELFANDAEANRQLARPHREPYDLI